MLPYMVYHFTGTSSATLIKVCLLLRKEIVIKKKILKASSTMYRGRDLFQTKGKHVGLHQKKGQDNIKGP